MKIIFILILVLILLFINNNNLFENFTNFIIPYSNGYTNLPWWNTRIGNTSNMSYDLRGDPIIIPKNQFIWNNSSIFPIYNKSI
jgi:hypothetical protein